MLRQDQPDGFLHKEGPAPKMEAEPSLLIQWYFEFLKKQFYLSLLL